MSPNRARRTSASRRGCSSSSRTASRAAPACAGCASGSPETPSAQSWKLDGLVHGQGTDVRARGRRVLQGQLGPEHRAARRCACREFGFTGTFGLKLQTWMWVFGLDLLAGRRVALRELRLLHAGDVLPRLHQVRRLLRAAGRAGCCSRPTCARSWMPSTPGPRDLRYFKWYQQSNPLVVKGDRRLTPGRRRRTAGRSASADPDRSRRSGR